MKLLALETSTAVCDVALLDGASDEAVCLARSRVNLGRAHSERIMDLIDATLREAGVSRRDLQGVAVSIGPGSFTGLRIGLSVAKGLCFSLDLPLAGVPTLDAIAAGVPDPLGRLVIAVKARQGEYYAAVFENGVRTGPDTVQTTAAITGLLDAADAFLTEDGTAWQGVLPETVRRLDSSLAFPDAVVVGKLALARLRRGNSDPVDALVPRYVQSFKGVMA